MATFVLVPGGWHGGWYFEPIARGLREQGHQAYSVTLSGIGERGHLAAGANLDMHIQDVVSLLEHERIENAVLCGHSYGGMVITGAADRLPERVDALVYSDAYVPRDGESCWELATDGFRQLFVAGTAATGHSVDPPPTLDPRASPHPVASFLQLIRLTGSLDRFRRKDFIYLSDWRGTPFTELYERLRREPTWNVHTLPVGHDIVGEAPQALLEILMEAAE
ncbi:alpha/beta fold hydrolase [Kutzneria albida]|uniref:AB hydrolase-1 domain-containing protein n=1 Tax=Kutzneria albida DSM 43870 TaxID=1449976 RepID=W5WI42_9PSEU|nr:alpha/beta fold hydrolase [Kutzneria albida]AHI00528.1 hypothetical protein KALB_7170 [Kutzneria albida DSM 43870]